MTILDAGLVMKPALHVVMTVHVIYHATRTVLPAAALVQTNVSPAIQEQIAPIQTTLHLAASAIQIESVSHTTVDMSAMMPHVNTV